MKRRFAFILARNFTLSPLALFIDTLRLAGDDGDRSRRVSFDWDSPAMPVCQSGRAVGWKSCRLGPRPLSKTTMS